MRSSPLTPLHESLYSLLHAAITNILWHSSYLNLFKIHLKMDRNVYTHSKRRLWESKIPMQKKFFMLHIPKQGRQINLIYFRSFESMNY